MVWQNAYSVKTPGGRLTYIHQKKLASPARCGDCKADLPGVSYSHSFHRGTLSQALRQHNYGIYARSFEHDRGNYIQLRNGSSMSRGPTEGRGATAASALGNIRLVELKVCSGFCVFRIVRAFLIEEQKIVQRVLKAKSKEAVAKKA